MTNVFKDLKENGTNPFNAEVCIAKQRGIEIKVEIVIESAEKVYNLYHVFKKGENLVSTQSIEEACFIANKHFPEDR